METVYLETSFISYLVSQPSRDLLVAAHQQTTHEWWHKRRQEFACYVSQVVIDEAAVGDQDESKKRMEVVDSLRVLEITDDAEELTEAILRAQIIPPKAVRDAAHIAVAAVHSMDYLLTWNCKHLANAQIMRRIGRVCNHEGYDMPLICTPEELMGG
jgi:predicted nucleic acid-binding protein